MGAMRFSLHTKPQVTVELLHKEITQLIQNVKYSSNYLYHAVKVKPPSVTSSIRQWLFTNNTDSKK